MSVLFQALVRRRTHTPTSLPFPRLVWLAPGQARHTNPPRPGAWRTELSLTDVDKNLIKRAAVCGQSFPFVGIEMIVQECSRG